MTDWRINNQEKFLGGKEFTLKKYTAYSETWDHDHCEFCGVKFMENTKSIKSENIENEGFATNDNYHWVCKTCFKDFAKEMNLIEKKRHNLKVD